MRRPRIRRAWARALAALVGVLTMFYTMPVRLNPDALAPTLLLTLAGIALVGWAMTGQVRRHLVLGEPVGLATLTTLLALVLALFSYAYYALETLRPGQIEGLQTHTDALYFTMQILTTVGLGDVHAIGQTARALAIMQMAFDLVFVAAAGSVLAGSMRARAARPVDQGGQEPS